MSGYHDTNPYHNSVHAADVTQAMYCFLQEPKIRDHLTPMEAMCSLLAAVSHDLDHPGVNQNFLVATKSHLAALYNVIIATFCKPLHIVLFLYFVLFHNRTFPCLKVITGVLHCRAFMILIYLIISVKVNGRKSDTC